MRRHFFIVAIVLLSSSPLMADDYWLPSRDTKPSRQDSPFSREIEGSKEDRKSTLLIPQVSVAETSFHLADDDSTNDCQWDFYPVCDHDCLIEYLEPGGDCECEWPCCTTDEWICHPCQSSRNNCYRAEVGTWFCNDSCCDIWDDAYEPFKPYDPAIRFGWWGVTAKGSKTKTGEFQDLHSSPFYDFDAIFSDGNRTLDFNISGLDNDANDARLHYYGPELSAKVRYDRFLRRWDHDPLTGADRNGPLGPDDNVVSEDLNVGEDYAIRVQQLDAKFQGRITDDIKWRINLWGQRKFGERQANATAHCFNINAPAPPGAQGNVCHVLSQRQNIDWLTMEIQPVVEARFDVVTLEYSRTMRGFGQDDQIVDRQYTRFGFSAVNGSLGPSFDYALVPESFTQIDRLKISAPLTEDNQFYGNLYYGDTENKFRDTHRQFSGVDLRLINRSIERMTWTGYATLDDENNELPRSFFDAPPLAPAGVDQASLRHPVDYSRTRVGLKGNWRPMSDPTSGFALAGGYEYYLLARDYSIYETTLGPFVQPDTKSHKIEFGPSQRWSSTLDTYVRYKGRFIEDPLIGVRENNGRFNSNQPEQEHGIELGGTWAAAPNLIATAQFGIVSRWHMSQFANFTEDDYPFSGSILYAPTDRLSLTAGYAYFTNWIDQDITLGFTTPGVPVPPVRTETTRWNYGGRNQLISLNASYAWTSTVHVSLGYEWDQGLNRFFVPPSPAGADWSLLPSLSDVDVDTQRISAGLDWQPYYNTNLYCRYVYFDYADNGGQVDSGTAHMALAGASVIY